MQDSVESGVCYMDWLHCGLQLKNVFNKRIQTMEMNDFI